jgi:serine/threonine-protein kinase
MPAAISSDVMTTAMILGEPCTLGDLLGIGGMGSVYAACHPLRPRIAVKILHESLAEDPEMVVRMCDEARAAASVEHRNVVRVVDFGIAGDGRPFIAMERAAGVPLGVLLRRNGPMRFAQIRLVAAQMLEGLAAIHAAGLVHGDFKSDNVLVDSTTPAHRATIIDFGLAHPSTSSRDGQCELVSGTPEYMAPEVIRGEPNTPAADIYAVGIILYEMLTGTTPFAGGTTTTIFDRQLNDDVVPPSLRCPDRTIPIALENLILRALDKDPAARPTDAGLLAAGIDHAIPHGFDDHVDNREHIAFSTTSPTREWAPTAPHPRRRLATGTDSHAHLHRARR